MRVKGLGNGGVMVNYVCNAACRHCLYACGPKREKGYMSPDTARKVGKILRQNGCYSVHIGGGEPFLNFEGLTSVIKALREEQIFIDYIETNAFWVKDEEKAKRYIRELLAMGVDTFCISIDPFHAEFVAPSLPLKLSRLCQNLGMGSFLWKQNFVKVLQKGDMDKAHSRSEFQEIISKDYVRDIADYYGIHYGGRAVNIEEEYYETIDAKKLLVKSACKNLLSTNHYHVDLHGNFIPPVCTGIQIPLEKITSGVEKGEYKVLDALVSGGVKELYNLAKAEGFILKDGYTSSCALCFHLRHFLSKLSKYSELNLEHYQNSLNETE